MKNNIEWTAKRKMRILHIISSVSPHGGGPIEGIIKQDEACSEIGLREILCLDYESEEFLNNFPMKVYAVGVSDHARAPGVLGKFTKHYKYSPHFIPWLRENAKNYDAIIVNGLWNYSAFGAAQILPKLGVPYFVFTHGMLDPWFQKTYPIKAFLKQIFWLFGEGKLLANAKSVFFTCEEEKLLARGQFWGYDYKETVVGYGTMTPPKREKRHDDAFFAKIPELKNNNYLLFISRIHEKKGCDLLIEAFAKIKSKLGNLKIVVAGPDNSGLLEKLVELANDLNVADSFYFPGPLYGDEKWGAFYNCDAFILPSHQENFGIVVAEALACGKPVLISNKVNIWREVAEFKAGIVQNDDIDGTISLLENWNALNLERRENISQNAVVLFNAKFNMANVGPELLKTIESKI